jgi:putative hydrolase of the HAD superfamily
MNDEPLTIKTLPLNEDRLPKVIFLDAVGTLFGVKGGVGEVYSAIALKFGVEVNAADLDRAFFKSFKESTPPVFPGIDRQPLALKDAEYQWWKAIAKKTFTEVKVIDRFVDFEKFFSQLYEHFATEQPWYIYNDVLPALINWQEKEIELGIISNFDTRLDRVLESLNLKQFFRSITISSVVGAAKPDSRIFMKALAIHNYNPELSWHIGDSLTEDYYGATAIGMKSFWLDRS